MPQVSQTASTDEIQKSLKQKIQALPQIISPVGEPVTIHRIELPCEPIDIISWLRAQTSQRKLYWSSRNAEFIVGAVGVCDEIHLEQPVPYQELFEYFKRRFNPLNKNIRFFGGVAFDSSKIDEIWKNFGSCRFLVPRFEIVKNGEDFTFAVNLGYKEVLDEKLKQIITELDAIDFTPPTGGFALKPQNRLDQPDHKRWGKLFKKIHGAILRKEMAKVVLARRSTFDLPGPIDAFYLKEKLKDVTPECYHFCFQTEKTEAFLGASPELLYRRHERDIQSEAVAGTRTKLDDKDLLKSVKENAEHKIVVDEIRADLQKLCQDVNIEDSPSVLSLKWGEHLITKINGLLKENVTDDQILTALHPTPAVAGYPLQDAIKAIKQTEPFNRGWYAGPFGFVGQEEVEFTVAIRSGLIQNNTLSLFAGAGIVPDSTLEGEWTEIENKMNSFFNVFQK